jgi:hypothetical protein
MASELMGIFPPAHREEITHRHFDGRLGFIVPIHAHDGKTPIAGGRHPNVLNGAGPCDFTERECLPRRNDDIRIHFPAASQVARRSRCDALGGHSTFALFSREILRADGKSLRFRQTKDVAEAVGEAVVGALLRQH